MRDRWRRFVRSAFAAEDRGRGGEEGLDTEPRSDIEDINQAEMRAFCAYFLKAIRKSSCARVLRDSIARGPRLCACALAPAPSEIIRFLLAVEERVRGRARAGGGPATGLAEAYKPSKTSESFSAPSRMARNILLFIVPREPTLIHHDSRPQARIRARKIQQK
jgi:hypothetical protein